MKALKDNNIFQSMSKCGNCLDNLQGKTSLGL